MRTGGRAGSWVGLSGSARAALQVQGPPHQHPPQPSSRTAGVGLEVLWTPVGWQWAFVIGAVWAAYELLRWAVVRSVRRSLEARVDRFLNENRIPTDPFRHTHRVVVREMVLREPGLSKAVAEQAAREGVRVPEVQQRVRAWLDEIVPQFNLLAYYRVGYALARTTAYTLYHVHLDKASLRRAQKAIPEDAAVVYVSNHRSNADFVVTGFMLSRSVQVSYAVGEWARVWPLEGLFRSFGSYFVRRGEKDPLYHRTLQAYVQLITRQGVTQAMFPEGGLTRNGHLRPPKLGLLDTMVRAKNDPGFQRPLVFVPVGINFDRVIEDENMVRESRGEAPDVQRSLLRKTRRLAALTARGGVGLPVNVVRFATKRLKKHGTVAIHFGRPVVFDDWYATQEPFLQMEERHARWDRLRPFVEGLLTRIGQTIPVTPVTLACLALERALLQDGEAEGAAGRAVLERGALVLEMRAAAQALEAAGAPFALDDPYVEREGPREAPAEGKDGLADVALDMGSADRLQRTLELALDVLEPRRVVLTKGDHIEVLRWDLVRYYAASLHAHGPGPVRLVPDEGRKGAETAAPLAKTPERPAAEA